MDPEFWTSRWEQGKTGFHSDQVHDDLHRFEPQFLGERPLRVLVPLAGKTLDIAWLVSRGHQVTAVELSGKAITEFHQHHGIQPTVDRLGPYRRFDSPGLTYLNGDVFDLDAALVGRFDRVWDRAAMVALRPDQRARYAATIRGALAPGAQILQNHFFYDQGRMDGPPFSVGIAEVDQHYADGEHSELRRADELEGKFIERGLEAFHTRTVLIRFP